MTTETWGIVLRDRATGAEQWVACEVRLQLYWYVAMAHGYESATKECAISAVEDVGRVIERSDRSLTFARAVYPAAYAERMENVRRILAADEVERLRAVVAERDATIADLRHASNRAAVAWAESFARCDAEAFRRGAEAMREAAAHDIAGWWQIFASEAATAEARIRRLPLPAYAPSQPTQSHEATATPDASLTIADAAARARSAAAQRATCDHRWVTTLDGLRDVCMRCPEVRRRKEPAR
jgi:hypothetical protein